ncbi:uncharacterized protein Z518_07774 [Rhinocladiella mackenziei CBS 650.93]|uniref:Rhinocladiella mackenziei CBS 650.93 unplaced genomic scaffold supercont1.5, whole genome shotgun sequence n=1 Tax=Rhinocladiella mackenziei CBS 650.93 TaxID=1442369 RepID=A0A0D2J5C5_9EURO|nr:uncharacterized protein Z518_07774 [Rhinocladiella mackenziei CBS 650.93]KIX04220.1 hypothetical protein Z518_07774 [Rhinocladiella mackenziei CBS 650.93]
MGTGQRFHLPGPLRRWRPNVQYQEWQTDGKEYKARHILGITETALNTARNQSISSSATARLPALSFSDATTELGSSQPPPERADTTPDLHLKASSVLLHEEFQLHADAASSTRSRRLKTCGSSSTLNSHYDRQDTPLAISQQTSDSSRRDFALRKGSPIVIQSTTPDKDSQRQLRLFRSSKNRDKSEKKKLTKPGPESPSSPARTLFGSQRSCASSDHGAHPVPAMSSQPPLPDQPAKSHKGVRFNHTAATTSISSKKSKGSSTMSPPNATNVKINIKRPKAGAKYWFDGLEVESSEDESIHEPELQQSFVAGMEMAFEDGRIGLLSKDANRVYNATADMLGQGSGPLSSQTKPPSSHLLPASAIPPRISTLNAKSSRSTLCQNGSQRASSTPSKPKASSLASMDLHHTSILDLSSSDDDEPPPRDTEIVENSLPPLRESIAVESLTESEIEIATAKAVETKQQSSFLGTPSLRRVHGGQPRRKERAAMNVHHKRPGRRFTYLSDQSSDPMLDETDLLTSFPATPTDPPSSQRESFQGSCLSDGASIESRRLMSVTRQEESLLAAMRLRKAVLNQGHGGTADRRVRALRGVPTRPQRQLQRSSVTMEVLAHSQTRKPERVQSIYSGNFDQASCTTFQTGISNDPSVRFSLASFRTETSVEPETDVSPSLVMTSPTFLAPNPGNRMSRSTFFSTSTNDSRDNLCNRRESHYLSTLEKLQTVPQRDEVSSQDFIDWPYRGWETRSKLAAAH